MSFDDIVDFHQRFERIHPFQDGNGRVGRALMFQQCLQNGIMPFIVLDSQKEFYYRGLAKCEDEPSFLRDTLRSFQDRYYARFADLIPVVGNNSKGAAKSSGSIRKSVSRPRIDPRAQREPEPDRDSGFELG